MFLFPFDKIPIKTTLVIYFSDVIRTRLSLGGTEEVGTEDNLQSYSRQPVQPDGLRKITTMQTEDGHGQDEEIPVQEMPFDIVPVNCPNDFLFMYPAMPGIYHRYYTNLIHIYITSAILLRCQSPPDCLNKGFTFAILLRSKVSLGQ